MLRLNQLLRRDLTLSLRSMLTRGPMPSTALAEGDCSEPLTPLSSDPVSVTGDCALEQVSPPDSPMLADGPGRNGCGSSSSLAEGEDVTEGEGGMVSLSSGISDPLSLGTAANCKWYRFFG